MTTAVDIPRKRRRLLRPSRVKSRAQQARAIMERVRKEPEWFVRNVLGEDPWPKQVEILRSVFTYPETSVASCNSAGKSHIAADAVAAFLMAYQDAIVVTTAPTDRQVKRVLWAYIRRLHKNARVPLGGEPTVQDWNLTPNRYATGFTTNEYSQGRFDGIHSSHILIVVDEAVGVIQNVMDGIEGLMASGNAHLLMIGNPINPNTPFGMSFKDSSVNRIRISAFDTPNFTKYGITQEHVESGEWEEMCPATIDQLPRPYLVNPRWVASRYRRWGKRSPFYLARVLARFPSLAADALFDLQHLENARQADLSKGEYECVLGVDVARKGTDETVAVIRRGPVVRVGFRIQGFNTMKTVGKVQLLARKEGATKIRVDSIGVGAGVVDRLQEMGFPAVGVNFGSRDVSDKEKFLNVRAEAFWTLKERAEEGRLDLPDDDDVMEQLAGITWAPNSGGLVQITKKKDLDLDHSPDIADAIAIAFCDIEEEPDFAVA